MANKKQSSRRIATLASEILRNSSASDIQRSLAASVLSQRQKNHQTGAEMEDLASRVLRGSKYNAVTKELAGSVLSQSNKDR